MIFKELIIFFFTKSSDQVTVLFERVKETIAERILVKSWLDDETRAQALLKLNSLRGRFQVSPAFYNDTLLNREMAEVRDFFKDPVMQLKEKSLVCVIDKNLRYKRFLYCFALISLEQNCLLLTDCD